MFFNKIKENPEVFERYLAIQVEGEGRRLGMAVQFEKVGHG
jgi:hypothetical protein